MLPAMVQLQPGYPDLEHYIRNVTGPEYSPTRTFELPGTASRSGPGGSREVPAPFSQDRQQTADFLEIRLRGGFCL